MSKSNIEFLHHAIDEIEFLEKERKHITETQFMNDEVLQRAFSRSLEIIGEAIKQVPDAIMGCCYQRITKPQTETSHCNSKGKTSMQTNTLDSKLCSKCLKQ